MNRRSAIKAAIAAVAGVFLLKRAKASPVRIAFRNWRWGRIGNVQMKPLERPWEFQKRVMPQAPGETGFAVYDGDPQVRPNVLIPALLNASTFITLKCLAPATECDNGKWLVPVLWCTKWDGTA